MLFSWKYPVLPNLVSTFGSLALGYYEGMSYEAKVSLDGTLGLAPQAIWCLSSLLGLIQLLNGVFSTLAPSLASWSLLIFRGVVTGGLGRSGSTLLDVFGGL